MISAMGEHRTGRPYKLLANYYDDLFGGERSWGAAARERLLGKILPEVRAACDLACGTGTTALELARRGVQVFAVDLSPTMCARARQKARRAGLPVRVIQGDMRAFRLPERVDLVTCEFDAINHVPAKADLVRVARSVARALRPGGTFFFDENNRRSFRKLWPGTWWNEKPGLVLVMHGGYDRLRDMAFATVEWFIREGRRWRRHREYVEEVCWTPAEIREALRQAGFGQVRAWDAAPFFEGNPAVRQGYRTYYVARKVPRGSGKL